MMAKPSNRTKAKTAQSESNRGSPSGTERTRTGLSPDWPRRWGPFALLVGVIVIVFGQVATFDFAPIDDAILVTSNPLYNPISLAHLWQCWREPVLHLYMPVTYSFYAIEAVVSQQFSGAGQAAFSPAAFHIGNLVLHCLNASLVLTLAHLLTGNTRAALLAALFFALHPLQVEAVAWISETKGILCNFFCLAGLTLQVYRMRRGPLDKFAAWALYVGMNLALVLALLAKPSAIAVLPISWIISVVFLQRSALISALELTPAVGVAAIISIVAKQAQGDELLTFIPPFAMRPLIAGHAIAFYLYKLAFPFDLTIDYGRSPEAVLSTSWIWFAWLVPVGLAITLSLLPHRKTWLCALAIFVVGLAPVSGVVSFLFQYYSTVSDRYVYLSMLGPSLAVAWFFTLYQRPRWIVCFAVLLAALALLSARQTATWKTADALFAQARSAKSAGFLTESNLGNLHADAGRTGEAIEHLSRAADLKPNSFGVHQKLGVVLLGAGRVAEAVPQFQEVVRLKPDYADGYNGLGVALGRANRPNEAISAFQQAIRLKPSEIEFHTHLMIAHERANQPNEAIGVAERALELARSQGQTQTAEKLEAWLRSHRASQSQP